MLLPTLAAALQLRTQTLLTVPSPWLKAGGGGLAQLLVVQSVDGGMLPLGLPSGEAFSGQAEERARPAGGGNGTVWAGAAAAGRRGGPWMRWWARRRLGCLGRLQARAGTVVSCSPLPAHRA